MTSTTIRSIDRLFDIIEHVQRVDGAGVTEIAAALGMPKSTVHSHLTTLLDRGYVTKDEDGQYHLSLQFLVLGGSIREHRTVWSLVRPLLQDLADETGEGVSYIVEHNGKLVFVGVAHGDHAIKTEVHLGFATEMHTTPEGKLLLAFLPEERRAEILDDLEFPLEDQISRAAFVAELEAIRDEGIAYSHESIIKNVTAISAPIIDNHDVLHGAVVVAGPSARFDDDRVEEIAALLKNKIGELNVSITYERSQNVVRNQLSTR